MHLVDYILIGLILLSVAAGFLRGFFREAMSLATWLLAGLIGLKFGHVFMGLFESYLASPVLQLWAGRLTMFLIVLISGLLASHLIQALLDSSGLSGTDRLLGMVFGFARGVLLVGLLVIMAEGLEVDREDWWGESQLLPYFTRVTEAMREWLDVGRGYVEQLTI